jgi:hypothetical protein
VTNVQKAYCGAAMLVAVVLASAHQNYQTSQKLDKLETAQGQPTLIPLGPAPLAPQCGPESCPFYRPAHQRQGPFRVVCPFCRNALKVTPPASSQTGQAGQVGVGVGDLPKADAEAQPKGDQTSS